MDATNMHLVKRLSSVEGRQAPNTRLTALRADVMPLNAVRQDKTVSLALAGVSHHQSPHIKSTRR